MLKEIPNKPNHKIVGFIEHSIVRPSQIGSRIVEPIDSKIYEPIYERILPLNTVYWDNPRNEMIYLTSDTQGFDCKGNLREIDTNQLSSTRKIHRETFYEILSHNGYEIKNGKLLKFGFVYITESCEIVICLADGFYTSDNTIVDCIPSRLANPSEEEFFFDSLEKNGFIYNPTNKSITESEKYYYFPSYSLYTGFQPEKKKWIDSEADKFYANHCEIFDTFAKCANWCNKINKALMRDYPKIKLEE